MPLWWGRCDIGFMKSMFDRSKRGRRDASTLTVRPLAAPFAQAARLARDPVVLMLVSHSRVAWMPDLALWIGELGGNAAHLSARALSPKWLQGNLWALKATAPGANFLIVEDDFAAGRTGTVELLRRLREERPDLVVLLVAQEVPDLGRQDEGICDGTLALPLSRPAFRKELRAAEARHAKTIASCSGLSPPPTR